MTVAENSLFIPYGLRKPVPIPIMHLWEYPVVQNMMTKWTEVGILHPMVHAANMETVI